MSDHSIYDVLVIGGGINGAGIARDAAGRGLSVLLCEQDDLAAHTSSASTKLIHGGLRYLEYYEFALVRKALQEREVLLRAAPHLIRPLSFVMPHNAGLRPAWMIRAGLFLYDHLARRELLPASRAIDLREHVAGQPLKPGLTKGFVYSDAWVDDARLVVLNALDAQEHGATILPRTRCIRAGRDAGLWELTLQSNDAGPARKVRGRSLFNAAGPWVSKVLHDAIGTPSSHGLRLAKGSHIVVPRLFDHDYAYLLQNPDRRILFAIPYERDFTVIGTTDVEYTGNPADASISTDEINYLCKMASDYFAKPVKPEDVIWSYSGVRPLLADEASNLAAVTRDYFLEADASAPGAPLISVFGGKITTYRRLAEEALALLGQHLPHIKPSWTAGAPLPGGDIPNADFAVFFAAFRRTESWLPDPLALRLARAYGTRVTKVLDGARSLHDLGEDFGGLYEAEIEYLRKTEWAQTAEDILWRRTKIGLHVTALSAQKVASRLQQSRK